MIRPIITIVHQRAVVNTKGSLYILILVNTDYFTLNFEFFRLTTSIITGRATAGIKITQVSNFAVFRPATRFTN